MYRVDEQLHVNLVRHVPDTDKGVTVVDQRDTHNGFNVIQCFANANDVFEWELAKDSADPAL